MSEHQDEQEAAELEQVTAELSSSLDRCRAMLRDCRTKLAANSDSDLGEDIKRHG